VLLIYSKLSSLLALIENQSMPAIRRSILQLLLVDRVDPHSLLNLHLYLREL
jgi:hypothetical protein